MASKKFSIDEVIGRLDDNYFTCSKLANLYDEDGNVNNDFFAYQVITPLGTHYFCVCAVTDNPRAFKYKPSRDWDFFKQVRRLAFMQQVLKQDCKVLFKFPHAKSPDPESIYYVKAEWLHERINKAVDEFGELTENAVVDMCDMFTFEISYLQDEINAAKENYQAEQQRRRELYL